MTHRRAWALPRVRGKLMRSSYSSGWAGASKSKGFGTPSTTLDLPASTAGSGGVTQEALRGRFAEDREDACTGSPRMSKLRARGFLPPKLEPACGADKDSSERPSIDGDSRPGGETMLTPSTDSMLASSPAESSLDASRVTTRRCREDSGASASSTALSALRRPAALALAAASPVGAGACSATAARRTSIPAAQQWCYGAPRTSLLPRNARCQQHSGLQGFTVAQQCAIATKLRVMIRLWRGAATTTTCAVSLRVKPLFAGSGRQTRFTLAIDAAGSTSTLAAVRTLQLQFSEEEDYEARRRFLGKNVTRPRCGRATVEE